MYEFQENLGKGKNEPQCGYRVQPKYTRTVIISNDSMKNNQNVSIGVQYRLLKQTDIPTHLIKSGLNLFLLLLLLLEVAFAGLRFS